MSNLFAEDGYRYGVMFGDGSVANDWNGKTQRARAEEWLAAWQEHFPDDNITLCRRRPYGTWERI